MCKFIKNSIFEYSNHDLFLEDLNNFNCIPQPIVDYFNRCNNINTQIKKYELTNFIQKTISIYQ